jgi:Mg/Co/Ni transporter MgtE
MPTTSWTLPVSPETDAVVRDFLTQHGKTAADLPQFVEEAVKWRVFDQTLAEARAAVADLSPDELAQILDEAVAAARKETAGSAN